MIGYLESNLEQIGAKIFPEGVAEHDGQGGFSQDGDSMMGQCMPSPTGETPVVSLQTAVNRMGGVVHRLKLDCEGAEWSILNTPLAFSKVAHVRMDSHFLIDSHRLEELLGAFDKIGFECIHLSQNQGFGLAWFDSRTVTSDD